MKTTISSRLFGGLAAAALAIGVSDPAFAHHLMGGVTPSTFGQGLLSGLGHPVIGLDHLAFIVGVGFLSMAFAKARYLLPAIFVAATAIGTGIHLAGATVPLVEAVVSVSVLLVGAMLIVRAHASLGLIATLFGVAGLFHGYAYGESIFGAEPTPVFAYLLGFAIIQYAIAVATMEIARRAFSEESLQSVWLRVGGGAIVGVAAVFAMQQVIPTPG